MTQIFRTEYAKYARPTDDPVWKKNGAHAGSGPDRLKFIETPLGRALQFQVTGGGQDNVFNTPNADRAEVMNERVFHEGDAICLATQVNANGYRASGGQWHVFAYDCHDANSGPTQSPIMDYMENDTSIGVRLWGGPPNGYTGSIRRDDLKGVQWPVPKDADVFVKAITYVLFSPKKDVGRYIRILNGKVIWDVQAATIVGGHGSYVKAGHYRATQNLRSVYKMLDLACFTTLKEGLDYLELAAPAPGPTPVPVPIPPSSIVTGRANFQRDVVLEALEQTYTVTLSGKVKGVKMFNGGGSSAMVADATGLVYGGNLDLTGLPNGPHEIGFEITLLDGSIGRSVRYPITVKAGVPVDDVQKQAQAAIAHLKKTTISYQKWLDNQAQGKYKDVTETEWWKALHILGGMK